MRQRHSRDPAIAQVAGAASEVGIVRRTLQPFRTTNANPGGPPGTTTSPGAAYGSSVTYPTAATGDLPARLAGLAAMIAAGVPLRCVALTTDTQFDTHSGQAQTFDSGVKLVADSLAAFQADLEARGVDGRVLVHVWSEFGRRAQENGSDGTDHGAAGASLLIGSRVNGGMIGEFAPLNQLDANGNQQENVDYRGVYCSLLEQWFDQDAAAVIPDARQFPALPAAGMKRLLVPFLCAARRHAPCRRVAAAATTSAPAHLLVYAQEWSLWPSRTSVPAGKVIVQLWNRGQDAHDLRIRRLDAHGQMVGPALDGVRITLSGHVNQATWYLKAGRYELYCSMPGHLKMGMHARLTVTRP